MMYQNIEARKCHFRNMKLLEGRTLWLKVRRTEAARKRDVDRQESPRKSGNTSFSLLTVGPLDWCMMQDL